MKKNLVIIASVIGLCGVFYPTFSWMYQRFTEPESYYTHGFLIPVIVAFLLWNKRKEFLEAPASSSMFGLVLLICCLGVHLLGGVFFKLGFVSGMALVGSLCAIVWYLHGGRRTAIILFPLLFLLLMVPLPKVLLIAIAFKLKMIASIIAASLVSLANIDVTRSGSRFYVPSGVLSVENECSGINSLISMFALSVLFAYVAEKSNVKRTLFVLVSLPIAVVSNVCRLVFLIFAAYVYGIRAAKSGIVHYGDGVVMWVAALAFLSLVWRLFQWKRQS